MARTYALPSGTFLTETGQRTEMVAGVMVKETATTAATSVPAMVVVMA